MAKALATRLIDEFQGFRVYNGQDAGEPVRLMGWQRDFIRKAFAPDVSTAVLSMGRGGGKSSTLAMVGASALSGILSQPGSEIILISSGIKEGRILFDAVKSYLGVEHNRVRGGWTTGRYRVREGGGEYSIRDLERGTRLQLVGSDSGHASGLQPSLVIGDEGSSWKGVNGERVHNLMLSSLGKVPGSRYVAISTRPAAGEGHWFDRFIEEADVAVVYAAGKDDDLGKPSTWKKANPSLSRFPELMRAYKREHKAAQRSISAMASFKSLRLNMGVRDVHEENLLLEVRHWEAVEVEALPEPSGLRVMGVDLSDGIALSAAVMVWESGRCEPMAMVSSDPGLEEREKQDGAAGLYQRMVEDGDLVLTPGKHVAVSDFIDEAFSRWGLPDVLVCDRYRLRELSEVMATFPEVPIVWRSTGFFSASEDLRRFRKRVMDGWVKVQPRMIWRSCLANARTITDSSGNEKLAKTGAPWRSSRARDDAMAALILATAEMDRLLQVPQYEEVFEVHG